MVRRGVPQWLDLAKDNLKGVVKSLPVRVTLFMPVAMFMPMPMRV